jgi:hypothetical protein
MSSRLRNTLKARAAAFAVGMAAVSLVPTPSSAFHIGGFGGTGGGLFHSGGLGHMGDLGRSSGIGRSGGRIGDLGRVRGDHSFARAGHGTHAEQANPSHETQASGRTRDDGTVSDSASRRNKSDIAGSKSAGNTDHTLAKSAFISHDEKPGRFEDRNGSSTRPHADKSDDAPQHAKDKPNTDAPTADLRENRNGAPSIHGGRYDGTIMEPIGPHSTETVPVSDGNPPPPPQQKDSGEPDKQLANGCPDPVVENSTTLRTREKSGTENPRAVRGPIYQDPNPNAAAHDVYALRERLFRSRMKEKANREGIGYKDEDRIEEDFADEIHRTPSALAPGAASDAATTTPPARSTSRLSRDLRELYDKLVDLEQQKSRYLQSNPSNWHFSSYDPLDHYNEMIENLLYRIYLYENYGADAVNRYDDVQLKEFVYTMIKPIVDNGGAVAMASVLISAALKPLEGPSGLGRPRPVSGGPNSGITRTGTTDANIISYETGKTPIGDSATSAEPAEGPARPEAVRTGCGQRELVEVNASNEPSGSSKQPPKKGSASAGNPGSNPGANYQSRFALVKKQIMEWYGGEQVDPLHTTTRENLPDIRKNGLQPGTGGANGEAEFSHPGQGPLGRGNGDLILRVKPEYLRSGRVKFVTDTNGLVANYFDEQNTLKSYVPAEALQMWDSSAGDWKNLK